MIIYLKDFTEEQETESIKFKDDVETDFVFRVYKDHNVSSIINECFSNTYHNKVKDGPRRPGGHEKPLPVNSRDITGGRNSFITKPSESDNFLKPDEQVEDTLNVIRYINGKVTLVKHKVTFETNFEFG